jgi:serine/threonine protein kinase
MHCTSCNLPNLVQQPCRLNVMAPCQPSWPASDLSVQHRYNSRPLQVPFAASSMNELRTKVMAGKAPEMPSGYSPALKDLCTSMLQVDPTKRPSLTACLGLPDIQARIHQLPGAKEADEIAPVLKTIVVPKNLKQLSSQLPAASYDGSAA